MCNWWNIQSWDIFVLDKNLKYLGRLCHRKECPTNSVDCKVRGCGQPPHLRVFPEFEYDEKIFLGSPIDILWTSYEESRLIAHKRELGILESRKYIVLDDIKIECIDCGKMFIFTAGEQKWYQKMGLSIPKRCPFCLRKKRQ